MSFGIDSCRRSSHTPKSKHFGGSEPYNLVAPRGLGVRTTNKKLASRPRDVGNPNDTIVTLTSSIKPRISKRGISVLGRSKHDTNSVDLNTVNYFEKTKNMSNHL